MFLLFGECMIGVIHGLEVPLKMVTGDRGGFGPIDSQSDE